jgi:hypothetical protein
VEQLEDRLVPSITDMTQLALLFPPHVGPTHLYLNFDRWHDSSHDIAAFTGTYQDIQEILFRASEILSPFNVQVCRISGDGHYDQGTHGNTTIFIGANSANVDANGLKYPYGFTPWMYEDFPNSKKGDQHPPNSDPFDVAFVDPVGHNPNSSIWTVVWSDARISQIIGHEAGTTFGLAHTLTSGTPDLMSYDSSEYYYANHTFPITDLNFTGTQTVSDPTQQPIWQGTNLLTQNSFTYLKAVLGLRGNDGVFHVADSTSVDPNVAQPRPLSPSVPSIELGSAISDAITSPGDDVVYRFDASTTESVLISLTPSGSTKIIPILLVHNEIGNFSGFGTNVWNAGQGDYEAHVVLRVQAGQSYFIVVGGANGLGTGAYKLFLGRQTSLVGRDLQTGNLWVSSTTGTYFTSGTFWGSWNPNVTWVDVHLADFSGDGKSDIVGRVQGTGQWWVGLSNGSSYTTTLWASWNSNVTWVDVQIVYFNGDGKAYIAARCLQDGSWWVALSTGSSFTTTQWTKWSTAVTWGDVRVGDFNGGGKADLIGRSLQDGSWWVGLSTSSSFNTSYWGAWSTAATWVDINVGDFNGDGKVDIVGRVLQTGQWWVGLSNGSSLNTSLWSTWSPTVNWVDVQVGDFNGDGKSDINGRVLQTGQWWTGISTGSSLTTSLWTTWSPTVTWVDVQVGDFNRDGKSDITGRVLQNGQWWTGISTGSSFQNSLWTTWNPNVLWLNVEAGSLT